MSRLLQKVKDTYAMEIAVKEDTDAAIAKAKRRHSWAEIAAAMTEVRTISRAGVRHRFVAWVKRQENASVPGRRKKETADA